MRISKFKHKGVMPDGKVEGGGAVGTEGGIKFGHNCGLPNCHCSDGYWACISLPRNEKGIVEGFTARFDSKEEFDTARSVWKH